MSLTQRAALLSGLFLTLACGGSASRENNDPSQGSSEKHTPTKPVPASNPAPSGPAYDGNGFVVHEWGTNTLVVGSDGSLQRGLHHEEEGLPAFVYDRLGAAKQLPMSSVDFNPSCVDKLETPVTYFYSAEARTVNVSVDFPSGVFTQWYPAVRGFFPLVAVPCGGTEPADPVLDPKFPFALDSCREKYSAVGGGLLDWGSVEILPRDSQITPPAAPLDETTWAYARQVAANPVRVAASSGSELENFLFYRGLGDQDMPVRVQALGNNALKLENRDAGSAAGAVFVLNVGADRAAFAAHHDGIAAAASLSTSAPSLDTAAPIEEYKLALGAEVQRALEGSGLFADEATAMVNTWKRQWFGTPGIRVLYLLPPSWTDRMIPLHISPAPDRLVRTLVVRVEVLTPELEAEDVTAAQQIAAGDAAGETHFTGLGRFAEPRLRRALSLAGDSPASAALLDRIAHAPVELTTGE